MNFCITNNMKIIMNQKTAKTDFLSNFAKVNETIYK